MNLNFHENIKKFNDTQYQERGLNAQRYYPNEEFIKFMMCYLLKKQNEHNKPLKTLDIGVGIGSNLLPLLEHNFNTWGIDISQYSLNFSKQRFLDKLMYQSVIMENITKNNTSNQETYNNNKIIKLLHNNFITVEIPNNFFDAIYDVFSSYTLPETDFNKYIKKIYDWLTPGGLYFTYYPSKNSDAFNNYIPSELIDSSTLNGIHRKTSPYYGNNYPFGFKYPHEIKNLFENNGFEVIYLETITKTYNLYEKFEFVSMIVKKP